MKTEPEASFSPGDTVADTRIQNNPAYTGTVVRVLSPAEVVVLWGPGNGHYVSSCIEKTVNLMPVALNGVNTMKIVKERS